MLQRLFEILGTIATILGAILTINHSQYNLYAFNIGSIFWIIWAAFDKRISIILVNLVLVITYGIGIYNV